MDSHLGKKLGGINSIYCPPITKVLSTLTKPVLASKSLLSVQRNQEHILVHPPEILLMSSTTRSHTNRGRCYQSTATLYFVYFPSSLVVIAIYKDM